MEFDVIEAAKVRVSTFSPYADVTELRFHLSGLGSSQCNWPGRRSSQRQSIRAQQTTHSPAVLSPQSPAQ